MSAELQRGIVRLKQRIADQVITIRSLTQRNNELTQRLDGIDAESVAVLSALLTEAMAQRSAALARADALARIVRERNMELAELRRRLGEASADRVDECDGPLMGDGA